MALIDLMQIYKDVYSQKVAHCALCFKSDAETRLVYSKVYKKAVEALKYSELVSYPLTW